MGLVIPTSGFTVSIGMSMCPVEPLLPSKVTMWSPSPLTETGTGCRDPPSTLAVNVSSPLATSTTMGLLLYQPKSLAWMGFPSKVIVTVGVPGAAGGGTGLENSALNVLTLTSLFSKPDKVLGHLPAGAFTGVERELPRPRTRVEGHLLTVERVTARSAERCVDGGDARAGTRHFEECVVTVVRGVDAGDDAHGERVVRRRVVGPDRGVREQVLCAGVGRSRGHGRASCREGV